MSQPVLIRPVRNINGTIIADAVLEERHSDEMVITDHPVEVGSTVSDHAYRLPATLVLTYVWSLGSIQNSTRDPDFLKAIYQQILALMVSATLVQVFTGKRAYKNMLVEAVDVTTDRDTENLIEVRVSLRELISAVTQVTSTTLTQAASAAQQTIPQRTSSTLNQGQKNLQPGVNFNSQVIPQ